MTRIAICTPCTDSVKAGFALDLAMLYGLTIASGVECGVFQNRGTIIPQQRATLVMLAMEFGATHVLFVDSDMRFPKDALLRLLQHDVPIVAANYVRRRHPVFPTAEHVTEEGKVFLFTRPDSTGLQEATLCGFGLILLRMDVFQQIAEPWFQIGYTSTDGQYVGEDFFFCAKARKADLKILIDHDLSNEVRHVGDIDYTHAHAEQTRQHYAPKLELVTRGA